MYIYIYTYTCTHIYMYTHIHMKCMYARLLGSILTSAQFQTCPNPVENRWTSEKTWGTSISFNNSWGIPKSTHP